MPQKSIVAPTLSNDRFPWHPFTVFLGLLVLVYGSWFIAFWPGVLGEDSLAILREIENPSKHHSGKPDFWFAFVRLMYESTRRVEVPIAFQLTFTACVFARLLAWQWQHDLPKIAVVLLLLVCAAPQMVYFAGSLYPDGIYAVAATGLLFEIWRVVRANRVDFAGLAFITMTLPFAAFARPNGIVFLLPVVLAICWLRGLGRILLAAVTLLWIGLNAVADTGRQSTPTHGVLFPLAIYETANFLQPRPMKIWTPSPRVAPETIQLLQSHGIYEKVIEYYDPDYWDPLLFRADGPRVMSMPEADRDAIVKQFFTYNLWRNIPKFVGSRVNVFLVAALAQGGLPGHHYAPFILEQIDSHSIFRAWHWKKGESALFSLYEWSAKWRWLLWTPLIGVGLTLWATIAGWRQRDRALLLMAVPMAIQIGAIGFFSIAGEYRYLLPFFILPVAIVPAILRAGSPTNLSEELEII